MTLLDIINWSLTIIWLVFGLWVFKDATSRKIPKRLKWTLLLMINPFSLKKYKQIRSKYQ